MTKPAVKAIPEGIHTITPHLVVRDAGRAAEWYKKAFGAEERGRIPVPGGKFMQIQEQFWGDRYGQIRDPFGYRWGLAQHVRDVPAEEIARIAATLFGGRHKWIRI